MQLNADADPGELEAVALATDFEREDGLWLVDLADVESLGDEFGPALHILWRSGGPVMVSCP